MESSHLIEPSVKDYLYDTLQKCHSNRVNVYYYVLNIGVFLFIFLVFGAALYYSSKHKKSEYEEKQKLARDQEYVLSKIRFYQEDKKARNTGQSSDITNLPFTQG
jgi:hypothetical protein